MMSGERDVQYLALPDTSNPYLLARVRWPDVCQAISPVRPDWQGDPGLFDLPYDPNSVPVARDQAIAIAAAWEARVPADEPVATFDLPMMRRMPANWSNLSRAEQHAWAIEELDTRPLVTVDTADDDLPYRTAPHTPRPRRVRRRWPWQRRPQPAFERLEFPRPQPITDLTGAPDPVLPATFTAAVPIEFPAETNVTRFLEPIPTNLPRGPRNGGWFDGRLPDDDVVIDLTQAEEVPTAVEDR